MFFAECLLGVVINIIRPCCATHFWAPNFPRLTQLSWRLSCQTLRQGFRNPVENGIGKGFKNKNRLIKLIYIYI